MAAIIFFAPVFFTIVALFCRFMFGLPLSLSLILFPILSIVSFLSILISPFFTFSLSLSLSQAHIRCLDEGKVTLKSIQSSVRLITLILRNNRRSEVEELRVKRTDIQRRLNEVVQKFASPEDRTLDTLDEATEENKGFTTKFMPKVVRRPSFTGEFL
jgi:hypothetical protein